MRRSFLAFGCWCAKMLWRTGHRNVDTTAPARCQKNLTDNFNAPILYRRGRQTMEPQGKEADVEPQHRVNAGSQSYTLQEGETPWPSVPRAQPTWQRPGYMERLHIPTGILWAQGWNHHRARTNKNRETKELETYGVDSPMCFSQIGASLCAFPIQAYSHLSSASFTMCFGSEVVGEKKRTIQDNLRYAGILY